MSTNLVSAVPANAAELGQGQGQYGRRVEPGRTTMLSIFPVEMFLSTPHAGVFTYLHPAAKKDKILTMSVNPNRVSIQSPDPLAKPFTLTETTPKSGRGYTLLNLYDTYQWCTNYAHDRMEPLPIASGIVAEALERIWISGRRTESGRIGIQVLNNDEPIERQVDNLWANQTAYFRSLVNEADKFEMDRDRKYITEIHRTAAAWIGIETRPWCRPLEERRSKRCVACAKDILAEALVCSECSTFLPEFHEKHGVPYEGDATVGEFILRMSKPQSVRK